jgi:AraC-like DNA-binding protein
VVVFAKSCRLVLIVLPISQVKFIIRGNLFAHEKCTVMPWVIRLSPYDRKKIMLAIEYVKLRYTEAISAEHLSLEFDMDARRMQTGFKEKTGLTIHNYIIQHRLLMATIDLDTSNLTLKVIADKHGFATQSHFIELFKKHSGITPNQYRNSARA